LTIKSAQHTLKQPSVVSGQLSAQNLVTRLSCSLSTVHCQPPCLADPPLLLRLDPLQAERALVDTALSVVKDR
jgi:hypothetical protein